MIDDELVVKGRMKDEGAPGPVEYVPPPASIEDHTLKASGALLLRIANLS